MAKLDFPNFQKHLSAFDFTKLFTEVLGWNNAPLDAAWQADKAGETDFSRRTVAELVAWWRFKWWLIRKRTVAGLTKLSACASGSTLRAAMLKT